MNFDVTTTEWQKVDGLTDGQTYSLQAKYGNKLAYHTFNILFTQCSEIPTKPGQGTLDSHFKFTKRAGESVYIRTCVEGINIHIEKVG